MSSIACACASTWDSAAKHEEFKALTRDKKRVSEAIHLAQIELLKKQLLDDNKDPKDLAREALQTCRPRITETKSRAKVDFVTSTSFLVRSSFPDRKYVGSIEEYSGHLEETVDEDTLDLIEQNSLKVVVGNAKHSQGRRLLHAALALLYPFLKDNIAKGSEVLKVSIPLCRLY